MFSARISIAPFAGKAAGKSCFSTKIYVSPRPFNLGLLHGMSRRSMRDPPENTAPAQNQICHNSLYSWIMSRPRTILSAASWPRRLGLGLLLLAVLLRGIVPTGYMPKQTEHGYALTFCLPAGQALSPEAARQWAALMGEDPAAHHDEATTSATCPFAMMLQAALTPAPVAPLSPLHSGRFRLLLLPVLDPPLVQPFIRGPPVGPRAPPGLLPV